jgi:NTP pyrophosphatase (non-canonical NTP hydrolase)
MNDLREVTDLLLRFRHERDWEQFHRPKDLAVSVVLEAAELLEVFQWKTDDEVRAYLAGEGMARVKEEIADVAIYILLLSHDLGIDLVGAVKDKIKRNESRYPAEKSRGRADKYDKLKP